MPWPTSIVVFRRWTVDRVPGTRCHLLAAAALLGCLALAYARTASSSGVYEVVGLERDSAAAIVVTRQQLGYSAYFASRRYADVQALSPHASWAEPGAFAALYSGGDHLYEYEQRVGIPFGWLSLYGRGDAIRSIGTIERPTAASMTWNAGDGSEAESYVVWIIPIHGKESVPEALQKCAPAGLPLRLHTLPAVASYLSWLAVIYVTQQSASQLRSWRRRRFGRCVTCGYSLGSDICPECGRPAG